MSRLLRVKELRDLEAIEQIAPAWSALCGRCPRCTPFQRPEWVVPWYRTLGQRYEPWLVTVLLAGELCGVAALAVRDGVIELAGSSVTDYLDVVGPPEVEQELAEWLVDRLARDRDARGARFEELRTGSPLSTVPLGAALEDHVQRQSVCPVVELPPTAEALHAGLPHDLGPKLARARRQAARMGTLSFETATSRDLEAHLDAFFRLHGARWRERGSAGLVGQRDLQDFHRQVARGFVAQGVLRLCSLRLGGRIIASVYTFLEHGRAYSYLGGFDPDFHQLGPGKLVIAHAMEQAIRAGAGEFDFLRGAEAHKYLWGARDRTTVRRDIWRAPDPAAAASAPR